MRRRTATGWRRWALGAGSAMMLCGATGIGTAAVVNASSGPSTATGAHALPSLGLFGPSGSGSGLPSLPVSTSSLPILGSGSTPCVLNCTTPCATNCDNNNGGGGNNGGNHSGGGPTSTASAAPSATADPATDTTRAGSGAHRGDSDSAGLNIGPPPSVLAIGPATSISFGKAPFLWPLFAALDVLGLVAVVWVVRKTWSRSSTD